VYVYVCVCTDVYTQPRANVESTPAPTLATERLISVVATEYSVQLCCYGYRAAMTLKGDASTSMLIINDSESPRTSNDMSLSIIELAKS